MDAPLTDRLKFAVDAAREAGQLTLRYFQKADLKVEMKGDASPVTIADRQAEQLLRDRISKAFPNDGILGEELGEQAGTSGYRWILDPIDGTKSFIHGVPLYAVLIGVEHAGQSSIGVIYIPALDEMVYAAKGEGAWYVRAGASPVPARVSQTKSLADSLFLTSSASGFQRRGAWPFFERLVKTAKITRTWGDAYGYLLVATGRADVMIDPQMNLWDCAALLPVLEEAGGTFTDWQGRATISAGEAIATNGHLLDQVLRLMK
jgi:histidinol-phosphatase